MGSFELNCVLDVGCHIRYRSMVVLCVIWYVLYNRKTFIAIERRNSVSFVIWFSPYYSNAIKNVILQNKKNTQGRFNLQKSYVLFSGLWYLSISIWDFYNIDLYSIIMYKIEILRIIKFSRFYVSLFDEYLFKVITLYT